MRAFVFVLPLIFYYLSKPSPYEFEVSIKIHSCSGYNQTDDDETISIGSSSWEL